ncbi:hypothetical protein F511_35776 [Dorcoceras hygrometricum]|uniref:Uncharacterized protein n=1 Tax=Dorcoceras hygrometricum TaxID=472368 RepID=A0A2Z7C4R7_9LAMI|nr:hypothetical protein F511_35776 [Dorcoceras hygrometricum]
MNLYFYSVATSEDPPETATLFHRETWKFILFLYGNTRLALINHSFYFKIFQPFRMISSTAAAFIHFLASLVAGNR